MLVIWILPLHNIYGCLWNIAYLYCFWRFSWCCSFQQNLWFQLAEIDPSWTKALTCSYLQRHLTQTSHGPYRVFEGGTIQIRVHLLGALQSDVSCISGRSNSSVAWNLPKSVYHTVTDKKKETVVNENTPVHVQNVYEVTCNSWKSIWRCKYWGLLITVISQFHTMSGS